MAAMVIEREAAPVRNLSLSKKTYTPIMMSVSAENSTRKREMVSETMLSL